MDPVTGGGGSSTYPDSVDSSPRSRGGESWDEPPFPSPKLRLMCSHGGRIVPRPTDKSLCYLGGDTRIVVVDRTSSLAELSAKLSRNLLGGRPFSLKYQLPNEDLDSLISVTTDEDLDNMIDEYDRIAAANPAANPAKRVRLFLFPSKPESAPSSIGSLLDDSKSETWFVDALNGAIGIDGLPRGMSTDSASVNCLLGLEDDSSVHSRTGPGGGSNPDPDPRAVLQRPDSSSKLDTTSSFGSASSAPSLSNLPPIRVRPDDRVPDPRYANIDDHFAQMNLQSAAAAVVPQRQEEAPKASAPPVIPQIISPTENPKSVGFGSEDEKPDTRKPPLSVAPAVKPATVEAPILDRPVHYQERIPTAVATGTPVPVPISVPDTKREIPVLDPTYRMQTAPEPGYALPTMTAQEQMQPPPQLQPQQQQQFIRPTQHYVQVPSYYQVPHPMQQTQQFDQQMPMYYLPVRQNPQPLQKLPPKTEMGTNIYRTMAPPAPMVHMAAATTAPADQGQMYNAVGYHVMHHHHPAQAAAVANYGYEYMNAVSAPAADPVHPQVYYTQATSPPTMLAQYQTMAQDEAKQNRGS